MILLESSSEVMRFTPSRIPQTSTQTKERLMSQIQRQAGYEPFGIWLAEEKISDSLIGWFMLLPKAQHEVELGFMLTVDQWGRGFATEIATKLIEYAKNNNVSVIHAKTDADNVGSIRVLEKLGFQYIENTQAPDLKNYQFAVR